MIRAAGPSRISRGSGGRPLVKPAQLEAEMASNDRTLLLALMQTPQVPRQSSTPSSRRSEVSEMQESQEEIQNPFTKKEEENVSETEAGQQQDVFIKEEAEAKERQGNQERLHR